MIFATLSDSKYLTYGLTMYHSIRQYASEPFELHYLCTDDATYHKLNDINFREIIPYRLDDLASDDFELLKKNNARDDGTHPDGHCEFHWALSAFFTNFVLKKCSECLYVDSDILFYKDPRVIFDCVDNYSIGLITHKHQSLESNSRTGYYNVGIVYFRNDEVGLPCSSFWKDVVVDTNNRFSVTHGTCGDQKYLELFGEIFGQNNVKIIDEDIGHGAPWNFPHAEIQDKKIMWDSQFVMKQGKVTQDLVFNHFSHFNPNYDEGLYRVDRHGEWGNILPNLGIKDVYDNYYDCTYMIKSTYKL